MSDYDTVRAAVEDAGASTPAARRQVYKGLTDALQRQIAETQPKFRRALADRVRSLRQIINEFEQDLRADSVRAPVARTDKAPPDPSISTVLIAAPRAQPLGRIRTVVALTLRYLRHLSRIGPAAAAWLFIEPILQMSIIVILYSLMGATMILDMEPFPFVVIGVAAWFMFRMTMLRTAVMPVEPSLALLPRVRLIDVVTSRAAAYCLLYTWAMLFFLGVLELTDRGVDQVDNLVGVALAWATVVALAIGIGLVLRSLIAFIPILSRFLPWINRLLFYSSGAIFVSEQMPDFVAKPLLLNPVLNAIQSMRSAYFLSYETTEASLFYAACCAAALIALGLALQATRLHHPKA